jgi:hypothetical protein
MNDQRALVTSSAGMRLIAQTTLYNSGDLARLQDFIANNYTTASLAEESALRRAQAWGIVRAQIGRLRVRQVIGFDKLHVIVLMQAEYEPDALFLNEVFVEEGYPHKIALYLHQALM